MPSSILDITDHYDRALVRAQLRKELRCIRNVDMFALLVAHVPRPHSKAATGATTNGSLQQRKTIRHSQRRADGRFIALPPPQPEDDAIQTIDYGPYPVGATSTNSSTWENAPLDLPPVDDTASIQLALIDVLQALAANQLDTKRAGLLLYGLQVASANVQKMHIPISGAVRSVTYTDEGAPLAPQDYGYDIEDYEDEDEEEEKD
jgi:hypothetical protein